MRNAVERSKKGTWIEGLILPKDGESLSNLWRAFKQGGTWYRVGKSRSKRLKFRHTAYKGTVRLERLGHAIHCVLKDDGSAMIIGAFLGHATRHGSLVIDSMSMRFS